MPAAIAIPAIIGAASAGTALVGAKMSSDASKNAAATQASAADKALAAQQQGYQQQRSDFAPYLSTGQAALGRLGATAGNYRGGFPSAPPMGGGQLGMPPTQMSAMPPVPGAPPQNPAAQGAAVRVQAPTGEVAMLSPQAAQMAVQKGAKVIG